MASPAWHYVLKFIITGDTVAGTAGSKLITLQGPDATVVKLRTAGIESFRPITRSYYRGGAGCLLVYDVASRRSFDNVRAWLADVRQPADAARVSCICSRIRGFGGGGGCVFSLLGSCLFFNVRWLLE
ncbi:hypothetical protein B0H13DRAFT_1641090 [Mycena leptocephala]|nr:hypothetical protein B0H13DRAFT_1641090 [Mycena leptocephala]